MTNNLGDVRHAMASQPSLYSEERKRLRIQAWEQRNQEVCQEKKGHPENVPLFGKPYKTIKWDELSCRIQRMLGSYEDGKDPELNPGGFAKDPPGHGPAATPPDPRQAPPAGDSDAAPSFHSGPRPALASTPPLPPPVSVRPPPARNPRSATADPRSPRQQDEEDEDTLDMEYTRLPQMLTTLSPLARIESPLHSSGDRFDRGGDSRDAFDPRAEPPRRSLVSPIRAPQMAAAPEPTQTPDESRLPPSTAGGGGGAPSQTFPPPLASKASGVVVTRKPTAYVRPMDGQDQVIMESPELKPSPEPYEPLPDKMGHHHHNHHHHHHNNNNGINNSSALSKTLPRSLETRPNEAQCVEDILREMTHSWPPLLTTIQTPGAPQTAPRSPPTAKIVEHVQKQLPGKEHYDSPPTESSVSSQQSSACVAEAAHSSGVESASSSDSESSSASDSESESARRRPAHPPRSSPAEVKTTAPHGDWQLANWIRSGQQNPGSASQTPPHRPAPPSQRSSNTREAAAAAAAAAAVATALRPPGDYKPHVSPDQEESSYSQAAEPQRFRSSSGGPQKYPAKPGVCKSPSRPKSADSSRTKTACKKHAAKPGRTLSPEHPTAAPAAAPPAPPQGVTAQAPPADDKSSSSSLTFSYRPKVKTKTKAKRGSPATESPSLPKPREAAKCVPKESASAPRCPCGAFPGRCVCPAALSPGRPDRAPATPSVVEVSVGVKAERAKRPKGSKKAPKTVKLEAAAAQRPDAEPLPPAAKAFASLLVKIDLSLLSRVPGVSTVAQETTSSSSTTTTAAAVSSSSTTTSTTTTTSSSSSSSSSRSKSVPEKGGKGSQPTKGGPTKNNNNNNNNKKRPAETDKNPPKKKQKMEKKAKVAEQQPGRAAVKTEDSVVVAKEEKQETPKKCAVPQKQQQQQQPPPPPQQQCSDPKEQSTDARPGKDGNPKHRRSTKKHKEHSKTGKKAPKSILTVQASAEPAKATAPGRRPMLSFEDRRHPVKHYIKEAKKLKHKADAESDKVGKAFGYLEAAMFFAESGVAMETEPETTKSPYSMYEDTVELIKFTLKQKNSGDSWALPSENDFTVLCLKCQSLLQMAMFRCKHKVASKYSKTLKTHFLTCKPSPDASLGSSNSRTTDAASPLSVAAASPAFAAPGSTTSSGSSGPGSNHSCGGGEGPTTTTSTTSTTSTTGGSSSTTVSIPKIIHHVASSYVNITALFVSAHDMWEKAEALTQKSSGVLSELNVHMEPLSLSSGMKAMVQYTRQALHWLRLERQATWSSGGGSSSNPSN